MSERAKNDMRMLLVLTLVLSLFNVISVQFFLYNANHEEIKIDFGEQVLPSEERQKDFVISKPSGKGKIDDSNVTESDVYRHVNDRLEKYGYNTLDVGSGSSQEQESNSVIHLNRNSNQNRENNQNQNSSNNQNSNENSNSGQQTNEQQNSSRNINEDEQDDGEEEDNELPTVPPNESGQPAESVDGRDLSFDFDFGFG